MTKPLDGAEERRDSSANHIDNTVSGGTFYGPVIQADVVHLGVPVRPAVTGPLGVRLSGLSGPLALNVHRAIASDAGSEPELPPYVVRAHDARLQAAVRRAAAGTSTVAVLVGGSSTGKTRSCWEALTGLPPHWRLWHPLTPRQLVEGLEAPGAIVPHTVLWLDETQSYLLQQSAGLGEEAAVALRGLLNDSDRGPLLVLGTLWPEYWLLIEAKQHRHARSLLTGRSIRVPDAFTARDMEELGRLAGSDARLGEAAERAQDREVTQYLAGAPRLLERYETAPSAARAVIEAAMDLRRLGHGVDLPGLLLAEAARAYLPRSRQAALGPDWWAQAVGHATAPCSGTPGPLAPAPAPAGGPAEGDQPRFRLPDYLEQHGLRARAHEVPGPAFWDAAAAHSAAGEDAETLGRSAELRLRLRHAALLYRAAHAADRRRAVYGLAGLQERLGHHGEAERLAEQAAAGKDMTVFQLLARMREQAGELDGAERMYRANIKAGSRFAAWDLAWMRERHGDPSAMDRLLAKSLRAGDDDAQLVVPWVRMGSDKHPLLDELVHDAAARSSVVALWALASSGGGQERRQATQAIETEQSARWSADAGDSRALEALARMNAAEPRWRSLLRYGLEPDGTVSEPWE